MILKKQGRQSSRASLAVIMIETSPADTQRANTPMDAVDIDSTGRNIIPPDFAAWVRTHDRELRAAENRRGIQAGRDMSNPDMGHWGRAEEWIRLTTDGVVSEVEFQQRVEAVL
jgi:hypothetical protein